MWESIQPFLVTRFLPPVYNILLKIRTFIQYYGCYACASVSIYKRPSYISFWRVYVKNCRSLVLRLDTYIMPIAFLCLLFFFIHPLSFFLTYGKTSLVNDRAKNWSLPDIVLCAAHKNRCTGRFLPFFFFLRDFRKLDARVNGKYRT